jgi:hypothetical protein
VTESRGIGTSGGSAGTGGISPVLLRTLLLGAFFAYAMIQMTTDVYSILADYERAGNPVPSWQVWTREGSSVVALFILFVPIWWAVGRFRPPAMALPLALAAHAATTVPFSLAHVGMMVAIRKAIFRLAGESYTFFHDFPAELLYEYRKDVATYAQIALTVLLIQWLVSRYATPPAAAPASEAISVSDGAVIHRVPIDEVDSVEAAGNYVELAWQGRTLLHRATLASMEEMLAAHGFVRIHRSRLVRRGAVRRVETNQSGDFAVELESGARLRGSRRYRSLLDHGSAV